MTAADHSVQPDPSDRWLPFSDATMTRIGRAMMVAAVAIAVVSASVRVALGHGSFGLIQLTVLAVGFGALTWVMLGPQPRNGAVWVLAWTAVFAGLNLIGQATTAIEAGDTFTRDEIRDRLPTEFEFPANIGFWLGEWTWQPAFMLPASLALLLFPDGRLPGRRWRVVGWIAVGTIALASVPVLWATNPTSTYDYSPDGDGLIPLLATIGFFGSMAVGLVCLVALLVRYRRSQPETRRQIRVVVVGFIGFLVGATGSVIVDVVTGGGVNTSDSPVLDRLLLLSGEIILIVSFAIGILKFRLYDLDVVISKAFTSLTLAAFITMTYVGLVVGVGGLVGGGSGFVLSIAATTVVAIAFQPVRRLVQRAANRLVYGDRVSPYEVLARFGHRAAERSDDELITQVPELVVAGTAATEATLWLQSDENMVPTASWPGGAEPVGESPEQASQTLPIVHDGELLGQLTLVEARDERLSPTDEQLVSDLTSALGLVLRNTRLTSRLRAQIDELAASRQRVLAAADEARRSLERDLDRGPQQSLAAIKSGLREASDEAAVAGAGPLATMLAGLVGDADNAQEEVRDFAQGVFPRLLEAEGLAAAIADQADGAPLLLEITADDLGRYPQEIEAAVYFTVLEAFQNAIKHAEANSATLTLAEVGGDLRFEFADDGQGFDPAAVAKGAGLGGLSDRVDVIGGTVELQAAPGQGTVVRGSVPLPVSVES